MSLPSMLPNAVAMSFTSFTRILHPSPMIFLDSATAAFIPPLGKDAWYDSRSARVSSQLSLRRLRRALRSLWGFCVSRTRVSVSVGAEMARGARAVRRRMVESCIFYFVGSYYGGAVWCEQICKTLGGSANRFDMTCLTWDCVDIFLRAEYPHEHGQFRGRPQRYLYSSNIYITSM